MTEQAVREAEKYIEQVLKSQQKLGYTTPGTPVVKAAVDDAAQAMLALFGLRANNRNGH